ncbi:oligosaccharide flippase family protein [Vagococcus lutrae]|uniref:oligosaccharide flippase family protein n=1 Tax=Vagococcus lutrae TaxID=81947 RepID=UPI0028919733|nr:oligosaccharide flippase family protein [Vagococcus lutrae]MDT2808520.1 oligosaccharide flippase family protein [Vagococcus lutrae]
MNIKKYVLTNGIWLYLLQGFNLLFPLITLPYLTRTLGAENYGYFALAVNYIGYFQVLIDYGFNLTSSKKVIESSPKEINKIFTTTIITKVFFFVISSIIIIIISLVKNSIFSPIFLCTILILVGNTFEQTWLFQGIKKMRITSIINISYRILLVLLIFITIENSNDTLLYTFIYSLSYALSGITSFLVAIKYLNIKLMNISIKDIESSLREGFSIFFTSFGSKVTTNFGVTMLGVFSTTKDVGTFVMIQKISVVMVMMFLPFSQMMYPLSVEAFKKSWSKGISFVKNIIFIIGTLLFIAVFVISFFNETIVTLFYGVEFTSYGGLFIILMVWGSISIMNNLLGIQILVANGDNQIYRKAFQFNFLFLIISNIILSYLFSLYGVAYATLISELFLMFLLLRYIIKINKNIMNEER